MKFSKQLIACAVAAGLAAPMSAFATNGYFAHGYGTKNKGLAGSGAALPQDAMIAATNPAGMAFVGERMDLGLAIFSPSRDYKAGPSSTGLPDGVFCAPAGECPFTIGGAGGSQSIDSDNDFFLIPHFAYNWQLNEKNTLGVTVYGNGGMNTEYEGGSAQHNDGLGNSISTPGTFGGGKAGVNLEQLFVNLSWSYKYRDTGAFGLAPILAYQRFSADGLGQFAGFSSNPAKLTNNGTDTSTGFGFKLGWQDTVAKGLTLAASYQSKMSMSEFDDYAGLYAEKGGFDIPPTWTLGLAWKVAKTGTLTFDVQQIMYSEVTSIGNPISRFFNPGCTAGPTGGTGTGCLGASDGAGFGWEDITVYKLGYQWSTSPEWTWRVGASIGDQPIPDSEVLFNILAPGIMETHLTGGFTYNMSENTEFSFAAMYAPENTVTGINTFDPTQTIELSMSQYELEASWGWKF